MNRIERLEKYIADFFSTRWEDFNWFWRTTHEQRTWGLYPMKDGNLIMDFILSLESNISENFLGGKLIPQRFATPDALFTALNNFKIFLDRDRPLLEQHLQGEETEYVISHTLEFCDELLQMIAYCKQVYDLDNVNIPADDLRYALIKKDTVEFFRILKSILSTVSYAISKTKEGYHHSNVHLILRLLGFDIIAEEQTNNGRIDAVIRFVDLIYILEFKFGKDSDKSQEALQQIMTMDYANKFYIDKKEVIGIGVSFETKTRNINGYQEKILIAKL